MTEFWMFAWTVIIGGAVLVFGSHIECAALRLGLWMNGIDGPEADRIIEFDRTGRLPE